jgi:hypothetical protein
MQGWTHQVGLCWQAQGLRLAHEEVEQAETDHVGLLHGIGVSGKRSEAAEKGQRTFDEKRSLPLKGISRVERVVARGRRIRGREESNYSLRTVPR